MHGNRAQLSLVIDDDELYNNFIQPYKQNKALHGVIIRCLSAYYYNEEVRNAIEGVSYSDVSDTGSGKSAQELCDEIRASLVMQDYLASAIQSSLEAGASDVEDMLGRTNEFASSSGMAKTTQSEYGSGILQLESKKSDTQSSEGSSSETKSSALSTGQFEMIMKALELLAKGSGNVEVINLLHSSSDTGKPEEAPVQEKSVSYDATSQVQKEEKEEEVKISVAQSEEAKEEVNTSEINAESTGSNSVTPVEDASDALRDLFSSLGY